MMETNVAPISLQLHTLRDLDWTFDRKISFARETGYRGVELVPRGLPSDARLVADVLKRHGVIPVASHMRLRPLLDATDEVLAFHEVIGCPKLVIVILEPQEMGDHGPAAWRAIGQQLNGLGRGLRDRGFELGFHNHLDEFELVEGRLALEWMLESIAPENVFLELDLGWVRRAGHDPVTILERFQGRCRLIHVKEPSDGTGPPESLRRILPRTLEDRRMQLQSWHPHEPYLGDGTEDWAEILRVCERTGVASCIVEYEGQASPVLAAQRGWEVLAQNLAV